jgi:NAD(P)-dependent dehydrogenase (short-subunit alcohol dehydrogenase family)
MSAYGVHARSTFKTLAPSQSRNEGADMDRLKGKRALITGGTTGIGLATARHFLAEGARVMVTGRRADTLAAAREALGPQAPVVNSDAGRVGDQQVLADLVQKTFGQLDVVFINAGVGEFRPLDQWDEPGFDRLLDTNLKGPFFLLRALLPVLAQPASIVLNASVNAHIGVAHGSVYSITKAGLLAMARTLSAELAPRGIRVNTVSPGPVTTPIYDKLGLPPDELQSMTDGIRQRLPMQRFGEPDEIARAVVYLASDESSFMLGSEMVVDGGMCMR